jgi:hypothetical protein
MIQKLMIFIIKVRMSMRRKSNTRLHWQKQRALIVVVILRDLLSSRDSLMTNNVEIRYRM